MAMIYYYDLADSALFNICMRHEYGMATAQKESIQRVEIMNKLSWTRGRTKSNSTLLLFNKLIHTFILIEYHEMIDLNINFIFQWKRNQIFLLLCSSAIVWTSSWSRSEICTLNEAGKFKFVMPGLLLTIQRQTSNGWNWNEQKFRQTSAELPSHPSSAAAFSWVNLNFSMAKGGIKVFLLLLHVLVYFPSNFPPFTLCHICTSSHTHCENDFVFLEGKSSK